MSAATTAPVPARTGHPIGFWFFFWGEFAERCSYYGMRAILAKYMTTKLGVDEGDASSYIALFIAACYFFPLIGGFLADRFFGKYWTIVGFSLPYVFAQFLVGFENPYVVFIALSMLAMGSGVIKPNISTLMGLTYDQQRPGQNQLRTSAFSWFYMAINIGAWLSQIAMPWLRNKHGYQVAFLFPAALMTIALVIFALGKRFYAKETIGGAKLDPVARAEDRRLKIVTLKGIGLLFLLIMFFWAIFDQSASTWIFFSDTYMDTTLFGQREDGSTLLLSPATTESITGTKSFGMSADAIQSFNALFIILLVPISVWFFKMMARRGKEVRATRKLLIGFFLTASTMFIMAYAGTLAGHKQSVCKVTTSNGEFIFPAPEHPFSDQSKGRVEVKCGTSTLVFDDWSYDAKKKKASAKSLTGALAGGQTLVANESGVDFAKSKVVNGEKLAVAGAIESTFTPGEYAYGDGKLIVSESNKFESKPGEKFTPKALKEGEEAPKIIVEAVDWVPPSERVTMWWQVFAFFIITIAEILISVTGLELAFVAAPPSMKGFVTAMFLSTVFLANFCINAPITGILWPIMAPPIYFAMFGGAMLIVTVVLIPVGRSFDRMMAARPKE